MNLGTLPFPADENKEILALIETLRVTGLRLEELTTGEVDMVADREGRTFLLGRAQEQLRHAEDARQAAILSALPANIALLDSDGVIVSVNDAWRRFADANAFRGSAYGVGVNYLDACDAAQGIDAVQAHSVAAGLRTVLFGAAKRYSVEYPCNSPREQRWFLLTATPLAGERPSGAVVMHLDISAQKRAQEELRESERRFSDVLGNMKLVSLMLDRDARISYCNDHLLQLTGWRRDEVIGSSWFDLFIPPPHDRQKARFAELVSGDNAAWHVENEILTRAGGRVLVRWNNTLLRDPGGEVIGTASIGEDVTDSKKSAEQLHESELRFRQMAESIHEVFFLVGPGLTPVLYVSPAYEEIWDRTCASLYADPMSWADSIHPDDRDAAMRSIMAGAFDVQYRIVRPSGGVRWVRVRGFPIRDRNGVVYRTAGIADDITERVELERVLRESESAMRHGDEIAKLAHIISRPDGSFQSWSDTLPQLIGLEPARVPPNSRSWIENVHADDRARYRATALAAALSGARTEIEYRMTRGDGGEIHVRQVFDPIRDSANARGRSRWFSTLQDITEPKRAEAEVQRLNVDLERRVGERTSELEAANQELEAFDYSISHDLRAPLNRIEGFSAMLGEQYGDKLDARGRELLKRIADAGQGMGQLVADLFSLSTVSRGELAQSTVDVAALAESIVSTLRRAEPDREVGFTTPAGGLCARADAGLLRVVLENLIGNAWKFTRRRADARIEMACTESGGERIFSVRDNGAGFDSASAEKLFTPFKRLHSQGEFEGTGIGLATVQRIIRRHGGRVWAESKVDQGATFFFTLAAKAMA